jgi:hypothetical protein
MLNKNVQQRLQHIGDVRLFLDQNIFASGTPTAPVVERKTSSGKLWIGAFVAGIAVALIGAGLYCAPRRRKFLHGCNSR